MKFIVNFILLFSFILSTSCTKKSEDNQDIIEQDDLISESYEIVITETDSVGDPANEAVVFRITGQDGEFERRRFYINNKTGEDITLVDDFTTVLGSNFTVARDRCPTILRSRRVCYVDINANYSQGLGDTSFQFFPLQDKTDENTNPFFNLVIDVNETYVAEREASGDAIVKSSPGINFGFITPGKTVTRRLYLINNSETLELPAPQLPAASSPNISYTKNTCQSTVRPLASCYIDISYAYEGQVGSNLVLNEELTIISDHMSEVNKSLFLQAENLEAISPSQARLSMDSIPFPGNIKSGKLIKRVYLSNSSNQPYQFDSDDMLSIDGATLLELNNTCTNKTILSGKFCYIDFEVTIANDNDYIEVTIAEEEANFSEVLTGGQPPEITDIFPKSFDLGNIKLDNRETNFLATFDNISEDLLNNIFLDKSLSLNDISAGLSFKDQDCIGTGVLLASEQCSLDLEYTGSIGSINESIQLNLGDEIRTISLTGNASSISTKIFEETLVIIKQSYSNYGGLPENSFYRITETDPSASTNVVNNIYCKEILPSPTDCKTSPSNGFLPNQDYNQISHFNFDKDLTIVTRNDSEVGKALFQFSTATPLIEDLGQVLFYQKSSKKWFSLKANLSLNYSGETYDLRVYDENYNLLETRTLTYDPNPSRGYRFAIDKFRAVNGEANIEEMHTLADGSIIYPPLYIDPQGNYYDFATMKRSEINNPPSTLHPTVYFSAPYAIKKIDNNRLRIYTQIRSEIVNSRIVASEYEYDISTGRYTFIQHRPDQVRCNYDLSIGSGGGGNDCYQFNNDYFLEQYFDGSSYAGRIVKLSDGSVLRNIIGLNGRTSGASSGGSFRRFTRNADPIYGNIYQADLTYSAGQYFFYNNQGLVSPSFPGSQNNNANTYLFDSPDYLFTYINGTGGNYSNEYRMDIIKKSDWSLTSTFFDPAFDKNQITQLERIGDKYFYFDRIGGDLIFYNLNPETATLVEDKRVNLLPGYFSFYQDYQIKLTLFSQPGYGEAYGEGGDLFMRFFKQTAHPREDVRNLLLDIDAIYNLVP